MTFKQYLVVSDDLNGENTDLFVTARDPETALAIWRNYYEGWDLDENDVRVFEVPAVAPIESAFEWPDPVLDKRKWSGPVMETPK